MGLGLPKNNAKLKEDLRKRLPQMPRGWIDEFVDADLVFDATPAIHDFVALFADANEDVLEWRFQAAKQFPFIMRPYREFSPEANEQHEASLRALYKSIDEGRPLFPEMQRFLADMRYAHFKHSHIKKLADMRLDSYASLATLHDVAITMDDNAFPKTRDQSSALFSAFQHINSFFDAIDFQYRPSIFQRRLASTFMPKDYAKLEQIDQKTALSTVPDTLRWLDKNIIYPLLTSDKVLQGNNEPVLPSAHVSGLIESLSYLRLVDIADINHIYHTNWARIGRGLRDYDKHKDLGRIENWKTKFPAADSKNLPALGDFKIVPLESRVDLDTTHVELDGICIDGYAPSCITGYSFCFALRDKTGNTLSAFEMNPSGELKQHQTHGGNNPPQDQIEAVTAYVDAVRNGTLKANPLYEQWRKQAEGFSFTQIYGYEKTDPDRARLAIRLLQELGGLPRSFKRMLSSLKDSFDAQPTLPFRYEP